MLFFKLISHFLFIIISFRFGSFGRRCYLLPPFYLIGCSRIHFGARVRIYHSARIEVYLPGQLIISEDVSIGHNLHLSVKGDLLIGPGCLISSNVFIGSLSHVADQSCMLPLSQQPVLGRVTTICKNVFIGTGACVLPGSFIGEGSIIGAGVIVCGYIPPYSKIYGSSPNVVGRSGSPYPK